MLPVVIFERIIDFLELKEKFYLAVVAELDHWLIRKNNVAIGFAPKLDHNPYNFEGWSNLIGHLNNQSDIFKALYSDTRIDFLVVEIRKCQ